MQQQMIQQASQFPWTELITTTGAVLLAFIGWLKLRTKKGEDKD
jgi:hypothetical protein